MEVCAGRGRAARDAPARWLLGHGRQVEGALVQQRPDTQVSGIVLAATAEQLPAACTTVIQVGRDAGGTVSRPLDRLTIPDVVLAGVGLDAARSCAALCLPSARISWRP